MVTEKLLNSKVLPSRKHPTWFSVEAPIFRDYFICIPNKLSQPCKINCCDYVPKLEYKNLIDQYYCIGCALNHTRHTVEIPFFSSLLSSRL